MVRLWPQPALTDKDGIKDNVDKCLKTDERWVKPVNLVNSDPASEWYGCAPCEIDEDRDGYYGTRLATNCPYKWDKCPGTRPGEAVDANGCSLRQRVKKGLSIDVAPVPVEVGRPARFTAILQDALKTELGTYSLEWEVPGLDGKSETGPTITGTVRKDYAQPTMKPKVTLYITIVSRDGPQRIPLEYAETEVQVRKPRVELEPVGPVQDKVGASVTIQAKVDGNLNKPPAGRKFKYSWYLQDTSLRGSGEHINPYRFTVPAKGLRFVKNVSVKVEESSDGGKNWQPIGDKVYFDFSPFLVRTSMGKVSMKVACAPSVAPPGTSVRCAANIEDPDAIRKLNDLASAGGRWGYYWYFNNSAQNSTTGSSIAVTIPKTGGVEVVARLMVVDPTVAGAPTYEADYGGTRPAGPQPQEVGRAGATLQAQSAGPSTGSTRVKYGPFAVPWGSWFSTGAQVKKGESFSVKATGEYKSVSQTTDVKTCGPNGCGPWKFFVLKAKIGNQMMDVGSSGSGTANQDGTIELGSPRGGTFVKEDAGNCTGNLSAEIWVDHKR